MGSDASYRRPAYTPGWMRSGDEVEDGARYRLHWRGGCDRGASSFLSSCSTTVAASAAAAEAAPSSSSSKIHVLIRHRETVNSLLKQVDTRSILLRYSTVCVQL